MKREIVNFFTEGGRKILTQEAIPVEHEDVGSDHVQQTITDMLETLRSQGPGGVGIAANQIGSDLAIFIIDVRPPEDAKVEPFRLVAINPKIVEYSGEPVKSLNPEGCLSGVTGDSETTFTTRYPEVTLRWTDEQGETHEQAFDGMYAWVIQHETDHLNGIFFTDRIESGPQTEKAALAELAIRRASTNSTQE
ncbi:peptide deformylase [Candidatus Nanosynbacter lyticus]|uniref:peptide deformylase n=1 Tax=Candidatus Nanosynbacter lyticus TaxID=2093824 RepID=UPI002555D857|nr:peptide deformylase [Candidatus Nanosynbacter lyticus]WLD47022.1 Peptide deformylase [Candidatus Nanosynbacter lyticus]